MNGRTEETPESTVIALCGYAGVGKDTFARRLCALWGYQRASFADPLKELVYSVPGPVREIVDRTGDWEEAKQTPLVRQTLQAFGVKARLLLGEDVWVRPVTRLVRSQPGRWVVADCRFRNELRALAQVADRCIIVQIERPGYGPVFGHVSETDWQGISPDHRVLNDGSIPDLWRKADVLARSIHGGDTG